MLARPASLPPAARPAACLPLHLAPPHRRPASFLFVPSPLQLTGRSGELVEKLFVATSKNKGAFDKAVKELESVVTIINKSGLVVDRFFTTINYSAVECKVRPDTVARRAGQAPARAAPPPPAAVTSARPRLPCPPRRALTRLAARYYPPLPPLCRW